MARCQIICHRKLYYHIHNQRFPLLVLSLPINTLENNFGIKGTKYLNESCRLSTFPLQKVSNIAPVKKISPKWTGYFGYFRDD